MDFDTDIKPKLTAAARWAMALAAGYLAQHGLLSTTTTGAFEDAGAAAILALGALVWSIIQKELQKKQVQQALATPVVGTMTVEEAAGKLLPAILNALPATPALNIVSTPAAVPPVPLTITATPASVSESSPSTPITATPVPPTPDAAPKLVDPGEAEVAQFPPPLTFGASAIPSTPQSTASTVFKPAGLP
jgi:hypothetical protein